MSQAQLELSLLSQPEDVYAAMDCETDELYDKYTILYCLSWAAVSPTHHGVDTGIWVLNWQRGVDYRMTQEFDEIQHFIDVHVSGFHNAPFDTEVLRDFGFHIPPTKFIDTLLLGYLWFPGIPEVKGESFSLKAWGERLQLPKLEAPKFDVFTDELIPYCIRDSEICLKLLLTLVEYFNEDDPTAAQHFLHVDHPYQQLLTEMSDFGLYIDQDFVNEEVIPTLDDAHTAAMNNILAICPVAPGSQKKVVNRKPEMESDVPMIGFYSYEGTEPDKKKEGRDLHVYRVWDEFNPGSDKQLVWALQTLYGWEPVEFSDKGNPKTDSDVLEALDYPLVDAILKWREVDKLLSVYAAAFRDSVDGAGLLQSEFRQSQTLTGRLSSSNPNLQNISTNGEFGSLFRKAVIAPPGGWIVGIDLQAIEYRVLASLMWQFYGGYEAEEDGSMPPDVMYLVNVFREGKDVHTAMAELWGVERKVGKNISYGR